MRDRETGMAAMLRRDNARLDPGVAFPFTTLADQIFFQCGKAGHQWAAVAVWAQPHVHAEHITVGSEFVDDIDQAAAQPGEEFMVTQLARPIGFAVLRVNENQIYIG